MKVIIPIVLLLAIAFAQEIRVIDPKNTIADHYIVVFEETSTEEQRNEHMKGLAIHMEKDDEIKHVYSIGDFQGFAGKLSQKALEFVKKSDLVKIIEHDSLIFASESCSVQNDAVWGLDRISETEIILDGIFHYEGTAGDGVDAYIIDTGILTTHVDFEGRAIWGANFIANEPDTDCNGHGTHVAGTVGGKQFGVAKKTTLFAVKVLGCTGSGSYAGVISGVNWALSNYQKRKNPSVANMSLGGPVSSSLDAAIASAVKNGLTFVVAAGNENDNACDYSPSRGATVISVGATLVDQNGNNLVDDRTSFSNWGSCVTIFAPGSMIESDWIYSNTSVRTISGTSMAAPHTAGAAALYLALFNTATPADVKGWLTSSGNSEMIDLLCDDAYDPKQCALSPNTLLYAPC